MKGSPEMFDACLSEVLRVVSDSVSAQFSVVNRHEPVTFLLNMIQEICKLISECLAQ